MPNNSILLRIRPEGTEYSLDIHSPTYQVFGPYHIRITREQLSARNQSFKDLLGRVVAPTSGGLRLARTKMHSILREIARDGAVAFDEVFQRNTPERSCILGLLKDPQIETIKICAEDFSLPWELICASPPRYSTGGRGSRSSKMWGEKYVLQRSFPLNRIADKPSQSEVWVSRPKVALAALRELPYVRDEIDYLDHLCVTEAIYLSILRELDPDPNKKEAEMREIARFFGERSDIAHFACHVQPHTQPNKSSLIVSTWFGFCPDDIRSFNIRLKGNPLVVLNACDTGIRNPLQTANFISAMLAHAKSVGVLATECEVPSLFAAAFAKEFYGKFLLTGLSIGRALLEARREFMTRYYNPLGLLYSLYQVDPDFHFVRKTP